MSGLWRDVVDAIGVVIPVNDEEALLPRCLAALREALDELAVQHRHPPAVYVILVLDACTDGSAAIAAASGFEVLTTSTRNVGMARAAGVAAVFARVAEAGARNRALTDAAHIWIANTDADSAVPRTWLTTQLALAEDGADLMVGTVRPDFADLTAEQTAVWMSTHVLGHAGGHVHGANLGVRGASYLAAGGFASLAEHEDVLLVESLRANPETREVDTDECWVLTSGRLVGRSPGGYAHHLMSTLPPVADPVDPVADHGTDSGADPAAESTIEESITRV
ncbi:MAG: glycosyltransferase [Leifsonia flava]